MNKSAAILSDGAGSGSKKIFLVGNPNVGKSALFQSLCGQYVEISNYPGTTVDISQASFSEKQILVDTPGVYSISALNEEERVTKEAIQNRSSNDIVINVISALSLQRDLFLTFHLIDLNIPFVLVINQIDEARKKKLEIDFNKLQMILGVQIFAVSALTGEGINEFKEFLKQNIMPGSANSSPEIRGQIEVALSENSDLENSFDALLWLEEDQKTLKRFPLSQPDKDSRNKIYAKRRERVDRLTQGILRKSNVDHKFLKKLNELLIHPFYGTIFIVLIGFFFLYQVLGVWIAGDLVDFLENRVFEKYWNPNVKMAVAQIFPVEVKTSDSTTFTFEKGMIFEPTKKLEMINIKALSGGEFIFSPADLVDSPNQKTALRQTVWSSIGTILAGKYGLLTLTITYLLGLLLPLVWFFYLSWAILEDTGYLPRLAVLSDGFLRKVGLNGRGVIPLVLGLGCVTMAVVTTRLMSSRREQLIMMILLGIAVPCSAQLGLIQGLLVKVGGLEGWLIWLGVIFAVLCLCGFLANKVIPGKSMPLLLDLPPLRIPHWKNLLRKANQKSWFFLKESGIAFFYASAAITVLQVTGALAFIIQSLEPLVSGVLHLPKEVALSFLLGMVRRDFGAFGLLDLDLSKIQAVTACVTLTLFVPCIATLGVMIKERNFQTAFGIWTLSWFFGFGIGGLLTRVLEFAGLK